ncbi:APC family permease [Hathewaya massiliensis]|uniref:APC family permease n=1 Tax=Hathewaya massiliensis TaxID=1964382 RepID=UPI00115BBEEF|nr:amino acid permease [Hathewaya massiliensis]
MEEKNLKKSISFLNALTLVIGTIIGSGIFLKIGVVFKNSGSSFMGLMAWVIGGVISLCSALTIAEVGSAIPKTGGLYVYLEELYDEKLGFLFGWVQTIIVCPASVAALAIAFANFGVFFLPMTNTQIKIFASIVLLVVLGFNVMGTKYGGIIQVVSTFGKLLPILAIVTIGFFKGTVGNAISLSDVSIGAGFGTAILGTLWAYDGWIYVTNMAGELKNPKKDLPRSIIIGVTFVIFIYAIFNFVLLKIIPFNEIIATREPAADAAIILFGKGGAIFVVLGIMVSVFGTLNGYLMSGGRVPFAMAERGQLPFYKFISKVHPKFNTPSNSLILEALLAVGYILSGSFNRLTDMIVFVLWIFFTLGVFSIFILRKRHKDKERTYTVPLYPITPIVGILGGLYIIISTINNDTINSLTGIGITLLGLPVYYFLRYKKHR